MSCPGVREWPPRGLEEHTVPHQVFVAQLFGVVASPCLDPLGNETEEGVADIPGPRIEVGGADIGFLKLDVFSDRYLLDPCIDDDNFSSCLPDCSASSAGSRKVAPRSARALGCDYQCLSAPIEGERDEIRPTSSARGRDPDVDLCPQQFERVFDSLPRGLAIARSSHSRAPGSCKHGSWSDSPRLRERFAMYLEDQ